MTETREGEYARLFAASKQAFRFWKDSDSAGYTALTHKQRSQLAKEVDPLFAHAITEYLPHLLPHCRESSDVSASLVGLCLIGEVKDIPRFALFFVARGVEVAPFFAAEQPEEVRVLLDTVDERGYPINADLRGLFFTAQGMAGRPAACMGIRSGIAMLRVLMNNEEKTREIVVNSFERAGR